MKEEHAGLGRKVEARGSATENLSSQTVTTRDIFLELGVAVRPYDSSTQEDQMFKASLGFEKRKKKIIKTWEKKEEMWRELVLILYLSPPSSLLSIPTRESKPSFLDVVCLL